MKTNILLYLLLFTLTSFGQTTEEEVRNYPSYSSVVKRYFSNTSFNKTYSDYYFSFEKSPYGWSITKVPKLQNSNVKSEKIWDAKTKTFSIPQGEMYMPTSVKGFIASGAQNYNVFPFYGYRNFENDIINTFKNNDDCGDSTLLALALAYTYKAQNISRNSGSTFFPSKTIIRGLEKLPLSKQEEMNNCIDNAVTNYKNLIKQNKNFVFRNKLIQDQLALEDVNFALTYESVLNEEGRANIFWNEPQFSEGVEHYAKTLLNSCDSNAILFTQNDIDTYPLLYLQRKGVRKDVWVININLLETKWYRSYLNRLLSKDNKDIFTIPVKTLNEKRLAVTEMQRARFLKPTEEILSILINQPDSSLRWLDQGHRIQFIKTQSMNFTPKKDGYHVVIHNAGMLTSGQLSFIDLVTTHGKQKSIHFTDGYAMQNQGLDEKFIVKQGLIYTLKYVHQDFTGSYPIEMDTVAGLNFVKSFNWTPKNFELTSKNNICFNYLGVYSRLADFYVKSERNEKAKEVLNELLRNAGKKGIPANFNAFYIINLAKEVGMEDDFKKLASKTLENYKEEYDRSNASQRKQIEGQINSVKGLLKYDNSFLMQEINRVFHFL